MLLLSICVDTLNEPPLQHKRRIADPYVTDQLLETTNPREIAELLQQSPTDADNKAKAKVNILNLSTLVLFIPFEFKYFTKLPK